jgi:hypothetical protein
MRILFVFTVLTFCWLSHGKKFSNSLWSRSGLVVIQAANLSLWFDAVMYEANEKTLAQQFSSTTCHSNLFFAQPNNSIFQDCFKETSPIKELLQKYFIPYFYPFIVEFTLLVAEISASFFCNCKVVQQSDNSNISTDQTQNQTEQENNGFEINGAESGNVSVTHSAGVRFQDESFASCSALLSMSSNNANCVPTDSRKEKKRVPHQTHTKFMIQKQTHTKITKEKLSNY